MRDPPILSKISPILCLIYFLLLKIPASEHNKAHNNAASIMSNRSNKRLIQFQIQQFLACCVDKIVPKFPHKIFNYWLGVVSYNNKKK